MKLKLKQDDFTKAMTLFKGMGGGQIGGPSIYDAINPFYHLKSMFGAPTNTPGLGKGLGSLLGLYLINKNNK